MKFLLLPLLALAQQNIVRYNWALTELTDAPDGYQRKVLGINNTPGYMNTVEATEGDWIQVTVTNQLTVPSSIHWHGIYQNGTLESDGPVGISQCAIKPGKTYVYKFQATRPGTFWWHAHFGPEYVDGLRGPIVIHMRNEPFANQYDFDYTVQLSDWYHQSANILATNYLNPALNPNGNEPVWTSGLINGNGRYNCSAEAQTQPCRNNHPLSQFNFTPGKRYRLRFINLSAFATFNVSIANHQMRVIEVDGTVADGKQVGTSLFINVAQRYSVIVVADQRPMQYVMSATLLDNSPFTSLPLNLEDPGLEKTAVALINYGGDGHGGDGGDGHGGWGHDGGNNNGGDFGHGGWHHKRDGRFPVYPLKNINTDAVTPLVAVSIPKATRRVNFEFTLTSTPSDPVNKAYITFDGGKTQNSFVFPSGTPVVVDVVQNKLQTHSLPSSLNAVEIQNGDVVDIVIISHDGGEHPLHLHGHDFWIMGSGTAADSSKIPSTFSITNAVKRDTVTVPSCDTDADGSCVGVAWTVLRFVADNPGVWNFHCHIDWHLIAGLGMTFIESPQVLQSRGLNPQTLANCAN
ncbi:ferroxidase fet3 [Boothiomyces sp. JEL0866]|nr:ferroxidase fet3 [Boothiomyces sp. JEL0866]